VEVYGADGIDSTSIVVSNVTAMCNTAGGSPWDTAGSQFACDLYLCLLRITSALR
jgi:hypothetical protein